jgi:hypothetical protein
LILDRVPKIGCAEKYLGDLCTSGLPGLVVECAERHE